MTVIDLIQILNECKVKQCGNTILLAHPRLPVLALTIKADEPNLQCKVLDTVTIMQAIAELLEEGAE